MRAAMIAVLAIGVCGVKDETAEKDSEAAPIEAPEPESVNAEEPVQPAAAPPEPEVPGLDAALARSVEKLDDGRFRVDPFVATLVAESLEETGGEPVFRRVAKRQVKSGVPAGYRVARIEKGSLFHRLGFRQGDIVTKVGTAEPPLPKRLRKVLETIEGELDVEVLRGGTSTSLHYELADDQSWHDYLEKKAGRTFEEPQEVADASQGGKPATGGGGSSSSSSSSGTHSSSSSSSGGKPTGGSSGSSSSTPESIPVSCSSSSSCTVAKWYFDKVVSSSSQMRSQAKISSASGGYKLSWVKPGSGVHKLLFRSGDIITRVNGRNLSNQLEALSLYAGLKSTRTYKVNYTRGGRSLTKTIRIV